MLFIQQRYKLDSYRFAFILLKPKQDEITLLHFKQVTDNIGLLPTGSVKVECSPPERKVVSSSHSRIIPKTLLTFVNIRPRTEYFARTSSSGNLQKDFLSFFFHCARKSTIISIYSIIYNTILFVENHYCFNTTQILYIMLF